MTAFYSATLAVFLNESEETILATLHSGYAHSGHTSLYSEQTVTWEADLKLMSRALSALVTERPKAAFWTVIFEFSIPRKEKRIDIVLLTETNIVLLESKRKHVDAEARRQVEEYALLLHYFHKPSYRRRILPLVVASNVEVSRARLEETAARQQELLIDSLPTYWIAPVRGLVWEEVCKVLVELAERDEAVLDASEWMDGRFYPVPTIIDAALALRSGLKLREIAHCEASEHEIEAVTEAIQEVIANAEKSKEHVICFLTGVPGSGKTLVGLSLAHLGEKREDAIHFMSGNGPLVAVLQENFRRQAMQEGVRAPEASLQARTLIEMIHVFAKTYMERDKERPPSNHVVIFDEAQRAWNRAQNMSKFKRPYSEPEMLLGLMARHEDWSVVVALVGGGQEINRGEAGLEEWGRAIAASPTKWKVVASEEALHGGTSTAGRLLFPPDVVGCAIETNHFLHLRTSNRSLRAESLASWVNAVLDGDVSKAESLKITDKFPIFVTRSLKHTRQLLETHSLANSRFGLVGSSGAQRLRAEGLEPDSTFHAKYLWHHWYLSSRTDIRSSYNARCLPRSLKYRGWSLIGWGCAGAATISGNRTHGVHAFFGRPVTPLVGGL